MRGFAVFNSRDPPAREMCIAEILSTGEATFRRLVEPPQAWIWINRDNARPWCAYLNGFPGATDRAWRGGGDSSLSACRRHGRDRRRLDSLLRLCRPDCEQSRPSFSYDGPPRPSFSYDGPPRPSFSYDGAARPSKGGGLQRRRPRSAIVRRIGTKLTPTGSNNKAPGREAHPG